MNADEHRRPRRPRSASLGTVPSNLAAAALGVPFSGDLMDHAGSAPPGMVDVATTALTEVPLPGTSARVVGGCR